MTPAHSFDPDLLPPAERAAYANGFAAGQDSMRKIIDELKGQLRKEVIWGQLTQRSVLELIKE